MLLCVSGFAATPQESAAPGSPTVQPVVHLAAGECDTYCIEITRIGRQHFVAAIDLATRDIVALSTKPVRLPNGDVNLMPTGQVDYVTPSGDGVTSATISTMYETTTERVIVVITTVYVNGELWHVDVHAIRVKKPNESE